MKKFQLPTSFSELSIIVKGAIEHYQGNPVKKENKLNDAIAHGMDFRSRQQLAASVKEAEEASSTLISAPYSDAFSEATRKMTQADMQNGSYNISKLMNIDREQAKELFAKTLGFKSAKHFYDTVSEEREKTCSFDAIDVYVSHRNETKIDGNVIDDEIFQEEMVDYKVCDLQEEINNYYIWISEALSPLCPAYNPTRAEEMKRELKELDKLADAGDDYVFSSVSYRQYISPSRDTEKFNEICQSILEKQEELDNEE